MENRCQNALASQCAPVLMDVKPENLLILKREDEEAFLSMELVWPQIRAFLHMHGYWPERESLDGMLKRLAYITFAPVIGRSIRMKSAPEKHFSCTGLSGISFWKCWRQV